jgi:CBS-domain-containing membrane protein
MNAVDQGFRCGKTRTALQCLLATLTVFAVLLLLDAISNAAVIAALGASSFIAFTMPEAEMSGPRPMVDGYLIGIAVGCLCHFLSGLPLLEHLPVAQNLIVVVFGALSVGTAIFAMVVTDTEHPPAASLALGLVLNECSLLTVLVILLGIVSLSIMKGMLRPAVRNLHP